MEITALLLSSCKTCASPKWLTAYCNLGLMEYDLLQNRTLIVLEYFITWLKKLIALDLLRATLV